VQTGIQSFQFIFTCSLDTRFRVYDDSGQSVYSFAQAAATDIKRLLSEKALAGRRKLRYILTMRRPVMIFLCAVLGIGACLAAGLASPSPQPCAPTQPDMLGPFYTPDAPVRQKVGAGYVLTGVVRSTRDCGPIPRARIEFWLTGPGGEYGDDYRATIFTGPAGEYRFESNPPRPYAGRPPHIHIRVSAEGYRTLVTQHYPQEGAKAATFDLVLVPAR
jgi:hypothetical protein